MWGWRKWAPVSPDGAAPSRMVCVSASISLPLHHKVQKFSFGTGSPRWPRKKGRKMVVAVVASWLCYCSDTTRWRTTKLCTMFGRLLGWYTTYTFLGALAPDGILPGAKYTLRPKSCILIYWHCYCMTLEQRPSAKICGMLQGMELQTFRRGRQVYLAGRPSCWAHILVYAYIIHIVQNVDVCRDQIIPTKCYSQPEKNTPALGALETRC